MSEFNIKKEELEDYLGYSIRNFKVDPFYVEGECRGLNVKVEPRLFLKEITTSIKLNDGRIFATIID